MLTFWDLMLYLKNTKADASIAIGIQGWFLCISIQ